MALLLGCLLVVLVLVAFLFEWRTALISLVAIPLSLMAAGIVLSLTGSTINTMVLAGLVIAIGVVVDDAIIDIENIVAAPAPVPEGRQRTLHRRASSSTASLEVRSAIIYATLIDALALLPVFFMGGLSGAFFRPLAVSYALAVLASMVVALTVTPALALDPPRPGAARAPRVSAGALAARPLRGLSGAHRPPADLRVRRGRRLRAAGPRRRAVAGTVAASRSSRSETSSCPLVTRPGTSLDRGTAHRHCGEPRHRARSRACAASGSHHRAGPARPTRWSASTSARTGSASTSPSTTTRRSARSSPW